MSTENKFDIQRCGMKDDCKKLATDFRMVSSIITEKDAAVEQLKAELEKERMRLVACGVIAMSNTTRTLNEAIDMHDDYKSASARDVERAVRTEIRQREEIQQLKAELEKVQQDKASNDLGYLKLSAENNSLKSKLKLAVEALRGLNNEVAAMIATHGDVISQDYGRTNLECLEHRLGIARQALSEIGDTE